MDNGDSTVLTWSSANTTSCNASGGWSGSRATSGQATVGPITSNTTYTLSCSGAGGTSLAMISVNVVGELSLNWVAPTENVDGTPLTDLASYRIYYGLFSRSYTDQVAVNNSAATSFSVAVPGGTYYVAMTAIDGEGNESGYSNEIQRVVQ